MADAIKFLHGSDFHLDCPLSGLSDIPGSIKATLANAPYEAAERFFETAISENVDFVLLSGDIADLDRGGPRSAAFLLNQFERLAGKEIEIYWCGGRSDQPDRWPTAIELPENVTTFCSPVVERVSVERNGRPIATIFGAGYVAKNRVLGEFRADETDVFPIALAYGPLENTQLEISRIRYWAMGGKHRRHVIDKSTSVAVYPGTIQSRSPQESGPHSCHLCRVDSQGRLQINEIEVDSVRWLKQTIACAENIQIEELQNIAVDRALKICSESAQQLTLVNWLITTSGEINCNLHTDAFRDDLLKWMQNELAPDGDRGIWSANLTVQPPSALPNDWYEEDTILGDYLRCIARCKGDESIPLGVQDYIPATIVEDSLAIMARVPTTERGEILRDAAMIGVEYLRHNETREQDD